MAEFVYPWMPQELPAASVNEPLCCDLCGEVFEQGAPGYELFFGKVGFGEKSGQPMVVASDLIEYPSVNLHAWCIADFARAHIYDDEEEPTPLLPGGHCECGSDLVCTSCGKRYVVDDEPRYCAGCEAKLSGYR